ncbi:UPF0415 protein C7orf25-like protein [Elysia marginata]|uniref:UPF0415 protein C7orf25-like protein n=1 Tax=Elysia marginata TaxID=1093978 RepID=A0AAV4EHU8_9GAST|nr:UPF0415 protein C7orf25-like protein [Elysia marginata]
MVSLPQQHVYTEYYLTIPLSWLQQHSFIESQFDGCLPFPRQLQQHDLHTQQSRLKSSNLGHLASLVHAAELLPGVSGVLVPYRLPSRLDSLLVDLLALNGHAWVKIVARKAQALHLVWAGQ